MGRYRLGDIVRMTRKSLSITQEQLSDSICSVETLSRIENGNQTPNKDTYELLMERMGRIRERAYSMLSVSDFKVLEKMKLFEDCIKIFDYTRAEEVLTEIKDILGNSVLDRQFLSRAKNIVDYRMKRTSTDEYLESFQQAIKLTIPKYGSISLANWPLSFSEAMLLINIAAAYTEKEDYQKSIDVLNEVYSAMKLSYMEEEQRAILQITVTTNLSKGYGLIFNHQKAIEMVSEGIMLCRQHKLGNALPNLLYNYAWNKEQLIDKGELSPENKVECYHYLSRAYYIALAMQQPFAADFILQHLTNNYNYMNNSID